MSPDFQFGVRNAAICASGDASVTKKPVRIMHVVDTLSKGGLQNGVVNVIERLNQGSFEHCVYAVRGLGVNAERLTNSGVRVGCLGNGSNESRVQLGALALAIREMKPDILHSRNWGAIEAVIAGRWTRSCAVVHSEHGLDVDAGAGEPWRRRCFRRLAFELADRVLSVSCQLRELHSERTGFPATRITVIHNGVDTGRFMPDAGARSRTREALGIAEGEFCIGAVGNLSPVKDYMTLLAAVSQLEHHHGIWKLFVIGDGPEWSKLSARVDHDSRLTSRVRFLGQRDNVSELLNAMDVYVLPSLMEGISNALLEAMATGLPVVATATGGNTEVVVDGQSGALFPVGDSGRLVEHLSSLYTGRDLRRRLGREAISRVCAEFSIDSMITKYEQVYASLAPLRSERGV